MRAPSAALACPTISSILVERSEGLFERICRLDEALYVKPQTGPLSPVVNQWEKLQQAAETGAFDPLSVWGKMK